MKSSGFKWGWLKWKLSLNFSESCLSNSKVCLSISISDLGNQTFPNYSPEKSSKLNSRFRQVCFLFSFPCLYLSLPNKARFSKIPIKGIIKIYFSELFRYRGKLSPLEGWLKCCWSWVVRNFSSVGKKLEKPSPRFWNLFVRTFQRLIWFNDLKSIKFNYRDPVLWSLWAFV